MYQKKIVQLLACSALEARLIEAYMRLDHGTLDSLSPSKFKQIARVGWECTRQAPQEAEKLAKSMGL